jgi:cytochrome-b5 reductase
MPVGSIQLATGVLMVGLLVALWFRKNKNRTFLSQDKQPIRLIAKESLSHDVRKFRFAITPGHTLGLKAGRHIILSTMKDGKLLARNYSPVSAETEVGYFELCTKVYFPNEKFPQGGQMSQYLDSLQLGDSVDVKGPIGKCFYSGPSELTILRGEDGQTRQVPSIAMIAGGVGITPFLAIIRKIFANPADKTKVTLLFANQTENDIFLRAELDALAEQHSNFKLWYTLDRPPPNWAYSEGFVTDEMIKGHLFEGGVASSVFLICGPPPMVKFACVPNLEKLGVKESDIIVW